MKLTTDDRRPTDAKPEQKEVKPAGKGPSATVARDDGPAVEHIRIRTQKNELLIAPGTIRFPARTTCRHGSTGAGVLVLGGDLLGPNYLLVVVQQPDATLGSIAVPDAQ